MARLIKEIHNQEIARRSTPRFEHQVVEVENGKFQQELEKFQTEGYELVSAVRTGARDYFDATISIYALFFKRPV